MESIASVSHPHPELLNVCLLEIGLEFIPLGVVEPILQLLLKIFADCLAVFERDLGRGKAHSKLSWKVTIISVLQHRFERSDDTLHCAYIPFEV